MILIDDDYEEAPQPKPMTNAQMREVKQWIKAEVRKAGGRVDLGTLMAAKRNDPAEPLHVKQMRDEEWIELAKEVQSEWDDKRAQKEAAKAL
jgi:hypothetical protein